MSDIADKTNGLFGVVNTWTFQVWMTTEMSENEFDAAESKEPWVKSKSRERLLDESRFIHSPDVLVEGNFAEQDLFGKPFRFVATVVALNEAVDSRGLLSRQRILKYHVGLFRAGRTIHVLQDPDEQQYVRISRAKDRMKENAEFPEGWSLRSIELKEDLVVNLSGTVENIGDEIQDFYQGPVDTGL